MWILWNVVESLDDSSWIGEDSTEVERDRESRRLSQSIASASKPGTASIPANGGVPGYFFRSVDLEASRQNTRRDRYTARARNEEEGGETNQVTGITTGRMRNVDADRIRRIFYAVISSSTGTIAHGRAGVNLELRERRLGEKPVQSRSFSRYCFMQVVLIEMTPT